MDNVICITRNGLIEGVTIVKEEGVELELYWDIIKDCLYITVIEKDEENAQMSDTE